MEEVQGDQQGYEEQVKEDEYQAGEGVKGKEGAARYAHTGIRSLDFHIKYINTFISFIVY